MHSWLVKSARRLVVVCVIAVVVEPVGAQQQPREETITLPDGRVLKPAGPGTITGFVADTFANALDSVEIFIASNKLHASAKSDGTFHFEKLRKGSYQISARRFGYFPQVQEVVVGDSGGVVAFALVPRRVALPTVLTSAQRGGLSGVIGDSAYHILEGAEVTLLATAHQAHTDSTGAFFIDAKPGSYMVRVKRAGYRPRLLSVTIPRDSGRRILVGLAPTSRPPSPREETAIFELNERLTRRSVMSKIYTREDINRMGMTELRQIAAAGAVQRIDEGCLAYINGGPLTMPIWLITAADIESVEIYPPDPSARRRTYVTTSIERNAPIRTQGVSQRVDCPVTVYVWLRQ